MKKMGFTLAEILLAIMIVGVVAVAMLPNVLSGIRNARYKAGYKKSYQNIHSIISKEYLNGQLPSKKNTDSLADIYNVLLINLSTKEYAEQKQPDADDGTVYSMGDFRHSVSYTYKGSTNTYGDRNATPANGTGGWLNTVSPWIITEDNIAYAITGTSDNNCKSKEILNTVKKMDELNKYSCAVVIVDTNGLTTGPNRIERQVLEGVDENGKVNILEGDRYYIYIGNNGVAQGSKATSLSARLMNNMD